MNFRDRGNTIKSGPFDQKLLNQKKNAARRGRGCQSVNLRKAGRQFRRAQNGPDSFGPVCGRDKREASTNAGLCSRSSKKKPRLWNSASRTIARPRSSGNSESFICTMITQAWREDNHEAGYARLHSPGGKIWRPPRATPMHEQIK